MFSSFPWEDNVQQQRRPYVPVRRRFENHPLDCREVPVAIVAHKACQTRLPDRIQLF